MTYFLDTIEHYRRTPQNKISRDGWRNAASQRRNNSIQIKIQIKLEEGHGVKIPKERTSEQIKIISGVITHETRTLGTA